MSSTINDIKDGIIRMARNDEISWKKANDVFRIIDMSICEDEV